MADEPEPETEPETEQPEEAPEPHEMFARTRQEGERRLTRSALELIFGMRFGADVGLDDTALNFVIAASGNMLGGIVFVTLTRTSQAVGSGDTDSPTR